tara:strand:- start:562 stop:753 length:192 start_codon:yes stop_codon:yes gene_type:complete
MGQLMIKQECKLEDEMLQIYAGLRIDGMSKEASLTYLIAMGYKPTHKVLEAIRTKDKYIFFGR